jgi:hypothetical protein
VSNRLPFVPFRGTKLVTCQTFISHWLDLRLSEAFYTLWTSSPQACSPWVPSIPDSKSLRARGAAKFQLDIMWVYSVRQRLYPTNDAPRWRQMGCISDTYNECMAGWRLSAGRWQAPPFSEREQGFIFRYWSSMFRVLDETAHGDRLY